MSKYDDLVKLEELREKGVLTEEEFQSEKAKILDSETPSAEPTEPTMQAGPTGQTEPVEPAQQTGPASPEPSDVSATSGETPKNNKLGMSENNYLLLMHLSQLASFVIPFAGLVAPIVMWQINKENPEIDRHGKNITNFIISMAIYVVVAIVLCFILIGIPVLIALGVLQIVFIILAAVKANQGVYWKYPLAIPFIN